MVRSLSLPKPPLPFLALMAFLGASMACARKGDPVPKARLAPHSCQARWVELRVLDVTLPTEDIQGNSLIGLEALRVYHLPLGVARPSPRDIMAKGEIILEQRRPNLPKPGQSFRMNLRDLGHPAGWVVVSAVRVGNVLGEPSESLPWLDPAY